mgnify:CR=1 FL=1
MKGQANFDNIDELFALGLALHSRSAISDARARQSNNWRMPGGRFRIVMRRRWRTSWPANWTECCSSRQAIVSAALASWKRAADLEAGPPAADRAACIRSSPANAELYGELLLASGDAQGAMRQFSAEPVAHTASLGVALWPGVGRSFGGKHGLKPPRPRRNFSASGVSRTPRE